MRRGEVAGARGAVVLVLACLLAVACGAAPPPAPSAAASAAPSTAATSVPGSPAPSSTAQPTPAATGAPSEAPSPTPVGSEAPATMPPAEELAGQLTTPGTLTVCLAILGVPAAVLGGDGEPDGYNVAFARELASRMGLTLELSVTLFDELTTQLQSHACDVSISSQNITESRLAAMTLTPYTQSRQPVVVRYGNPLGILELTDLCGQAIATTTGSTHVDFVNGTGDYLGQGLNDSCASSGAEPAVLQTYDTELEAVQALVAEEAAAYLGNPNFIYDYPDDIDIRGTPVLPPARQGIATALDRPLLSSAVEAALSEMILDGSYMAILTQYLLTEESAQAVSIIE